MPADSARITCFAERLGSAHRVADRLVIMDAGPHGTAPEQIQERVLKNGSRHRVYKRYFTPEQLLSEAGGGHVLHSGYWFVAVLV